MPGPGTQKTRQRVAMARLLFQRGLTRKEVVQQLREQYQISYESANRSVRYIEREMEADLNKSRGALMARQSAKLNHAQRVALSHMRYFSKDGVVVEAKPEPNVSAFVSAVAEQNKLLGLHAPSLKDLMTINLRELFKDIASVVRSYIPDREEREEFIAQLAERFEERKAERPTMIPAEVVVQAVEAAGVVTPEEGVQGNGHPPGGNGHANGAPPPPL